MQMMLLKPITLISPIAVLFCTPICYAKVFTLKGDTVSREFDITDGQLKTTKIINHLDGKTLLPAQGQEFVLHLKDGKTLSSTNFRVKDAEQTKPGSLDITLHDPSSGIEAKLAFRYSEKDQVIRKTLSLHSKEGLMLDRVELEHMKLAQAYQPYTQKQITAKGAAQWRPGIGQPLYTKDSGSFWGVEFPASVNTVKDSTLSCSHYVSETLKPNAWWSSHSSVCGTSDSADFIKDAFFDYIENSRAHPFRLQTQYNSWFDFGPGVTKDKFLSSVKTVNEELVNKRGVPALSAYVIDDGWQDKGADWSKTGVWPINKSRFSEDFAASRKVLKGISSDLGLWMSPGCLFGAQAAIPKMKAAGWQSLDPWMSMTGEDYMNSLEKRMIYLAENGTEFFKLDGIFGHLNTRNFVVEGFKGSEKELNDSKYDEAKVRYLSAGTERLTEIFRKVRKVNPDVFIIVSNGAWLSPWWLHTADTSWMINAGDAAGGADRTAELLYRDRVYHDLAVSENTQFPLSAIFNHEPKKRKTGETPEVFRNYLYANMARGTGFVESYIKTQKLSQADWDVLAEGLLWAHEVAPTFPCARMHGGSPRKKEPYGYTAWKGQLGYVSIFNPSKEEKTYKFTLNRVFGLPANQAANSEYFLTSPIEESTKGLKNTYKIGDTIELTLKPETNYILNFQLDKPQDWSALKRLQDAATEHFKK
ncbi:hypothetical protein SAMN02745181_1501 [Rubritalea squalenifaciens DSM 18772]|uniref:Alpha-galactosidase n=1 Tax=Rubritalea squalenifaciens DSM 18772 TaxID=1123071 RepID=A0A1M6HKW4_9BACT|nr:hypothetical protein [Rubritalea squalenifaciens]SHJ22820.1 hypothetical protein SAMN02745181_1501 [Rubritalea squalenifaciens DSM 18772]